LTFETLQGEMVKTEIGTIENPENHTQDINRVQQKGKAIFQFLITRIGAIFQNKNGSQAPSNSG